MEQDFDDLLEVALNKRAHQDVPDGYQRRLRNRIVPRTTGLTAARWALPFAAGVVLGAVAMPFHQKKGVTHPGTFTPKSVTAAMDCAAFAPDLLKKASTPQVHKAPGRESMPAAAMSHKRSARFMPPAPESGAAYTAPLQTAAIAIQPIQIDPILKVN